MLEKEYKERRSLIYKVFIVLVAAIGILLQCEVGTSGFSFTSFRMFTTLSNVAVAVFFVVYIALRTSVYNFPKTNTNVIRYFKFLITMSIILTGLVAHFMLRDMFEDMEPMVKMGLTFLHYVVPIATVFDWILFDEKGKTKWKKPLFATISSLAYMAITMIAAQFMLGDDKYPYPFLDVDTLGTGMVVLNIVLLAAAFLVVGYIGVCIDRRLGKRKMKKG